MGIDRLGFDLAIQGAAGQGGVQLIGLDTGDVDLPSPSRSSLLTLAFDLALGDLGLQLLDLPKPLGLALQPGRQLAHGQRMPVPRAGALVFQLGLDLPAGALRCDACLARQTGLWCAWPQGGQVQLLHLGIGLGEGLVLPGRNVRLDFQGHARRAVGRLQFGVQRQGGLGTRQRALQRSLRHQVQGLAARRSGAEHLAMQLGLQRHGRSRLQLHGQAVAALCHFERLQLQQVLCPVEGIAAIQRQGLQGGWTSPFESPDAPRQVHLQRPLQLRQRCGGAAGVLVVDAQAVHVHAGQGQLTEPQLRPVERDPGALTTHLQGRLLPMPLAHQTAMAQAAADLIGAQALARGHEMGRQPQAAGQRAFAA